MSQSMSDPKVAVITRTKDRPKFLVRAIKSVLSQTYTDYVHVILNDGGDKDTVEKILRDNPDNRRLVIHNEKSVGLVGALNQAIVASKGEYIVIHDDDDAWHPARLGISIATIEDKNAEVSVVPMEIVVEDIDSNGNPVEIRRMPHPESWNGEVSLYRQAHRNFLSNGAVMYSRKVYDELEGYDETLPTAEDWDFGIRLMLKWDVEQVISEHALVYYHQRPNVKDKVVGNSVHANVRDQERAIMLLRNRYLREDLKKGVLGVGYIMNDIEQNLLNVARLEGHINRTSDRAAQGVVREVIDKVEISIKEQSIDERIKRKTESIFRKGKA